MNNDFVISFNNQIFRSFAPSFQKIFEISGDITFQQIPVTEKVFNTTKFCGLGPGDKSKIF